LHGTADSHRRYQQPRCGLGRARGTAGPLLDDLTILELIAAYWRHANEHYRKNGESTDTLSNIRFGRALANEYIGLP
jgi:hypothetical protein